MSALPQSDGFVKPRRIRVGVLQIPLVLFSPRKLFERVENVTGYGGTLVFLLTGLALVGYAVSETGLVDRQVDQRVLDRQAELEKQYNDVVQRSTLIKLLEEERKKGEFDRMVARTGVIAAPPGMALLTILIVSALFYGAVALGGKKPEWHTLMTICVFASFTDLAHELFRMVLMFRHRSLDVDTSAALLARIMSPAAEASGATANAASAMLAHALSGIDPFRVWFWVLVYLGVTTTAQLSRWKARVICFLFWLLTAAGHAGLSMAART
jgi:hypothetical protein